MCWWYNRHSLHHKAVKVLSSLTAQGSTVRIKYRAVGSNGNASDNTGFEYRMGHPLTSVRPSLLSARREPRNSTTLNLVTIASSPQSFKFVITQSLGDHGCGILSHLRPGHPRGLFLHVFRPQFCIHFSPLTFLLTCSTHNTGCLNILTVFTEEYKLWSTVLRDRLCILYNQRDATYTMFLIIISALHVSGGISAHHQELIKPIHTSGRQQESMTIPKAAYSFISSWLWAEILPETCRALIIIKNIV